MNGISIPEKKKKKKHKKIKQNLKLFLHMLLKFEMIWMRIGQLLDYEMISIFLKHSLQKLKT